MLRVDCYDFYKLAIKVHPLVSLKTDMTIMQTWFLLYEARQELIVFFRIFPLKTASTPADTLYRSIGMVVPDDIMDIKLKDEEGNDLPLPYFQAMAIREAATEFESVLKAELVGWDAYFVSQKGAFSTSELIQQAETIHYCVLCLHFLRWPRRS
jgi:hypothetical protein